MPVLKSVSSERFIGLERDFGGRLVRLEIRLPPVNVLGVADLELLIERLSQARDADVLLVSGMPRAFSAGVEVADHRPEPEAIERMLGAMRGVLQQLLAVPAVTVACVSGACLGGGAEIVSACDLVYVAHDARIGFPEIRLACFPPAAAVLLASRIGDARAAEWILTGKTLSGRNAERVGFASRSFPAESLTSEVERAVAALLGHSGQAVSSARELLRSNRRRALARDLPAAEDAYRRLAGSEDLERAVTEFGAKRKR